MCGPASTRRASAKEPGAKDAAAHRSFVDRAHEGITCHRAGSLPEAGSLSGRPREDDGPFGRTGTSRSSAAASRPERGSTGTAVADVRPARPAITVRARRARWLRGRHGTAQDAADAPVALASSLRFAWPALETAAAWARADGDEVPGSVRTSFGASLTLARQILVGAPFELLVAADVESVGRLVSVGRVDPADVVRYAEGRLALAVRADSPLAPRPSLGALASVGLEGLSSGRVARGESAGQALQYLLSGAVDAALVPQSLVVGAPPGRRRRPSSSTARGTHRSSARSGWCATPVPRHGPWRRSSARARPATRSRRKGSPPRRASRASTSAPPTPRRTPSIGPAPSILVSNRPVPKPDVALPIRVDGRADEGPCAHHRSTRIT